MCGSMRGAGAGISLSPAVMFINSNKAAINIQRIIKENRQSCLSAGIELKQECIVSKGPDRDIDREAINVLITLLLTGQYEVVVVENMTDLTGNMADLVEFVSDASKVGIKFYELSTMSYCTVAGAFITRNDC